MFRLLKVANDCFAVYLRDNEERRARALRDHRPELRGAHICDLVTDAIPEGLQFGKIYQTAVDKSLRLPTRL